MILRNFTGHPVSLTDGERVVQIESVGRARVHHMDTVRSIVNINGISVPIIEVKEQTVYGLPDSQEGVLYIVSGIVQVVARDLGRTDVVAPGRFVRSGDNVKGARALVKVVKGKDNAR